MLPISDCSFSVGVEILVRGEPMNAIGTALLNGSDSPQFNRIENRTAEVPPPQGVMAYLSIFADAPYVNHSSSQ